MISLHNFLSMNICNYGIHVPSKSIQGSYVTLGPEIRVEKYMYGD